MVKQTQTICRQQPTNSLSVLTVFGVGAKRINNEKKPQDFLSMFDHSVLTLSCIKLKYGKTYLFRFTCG